MAKAKRRGGRSGRGVIPTADTLRRLYEIDPSLAPGSASLSSASLKGGKRADRLHDHPEPPPDEEWVSVASSNLEAVKYSLADSTLEILFLAKQNPATKIHYRYFDVPWRIYWGLMHASSKGTYHHEMIRGVYDYLPLD